MLRSTTEHHSHDRRYDIIIVFAHTLASKLIFLAFRNLAGGMVSRIFLSHSSANNAEALAVHDWLVDQGWNELFLDLHPERGLKAGQRWQEALKKAAERCELVIFLVSPAWASSKWCLAEFLLAQNLNKRIFGVLVEPTPFDDLPVEMTNEWQLVDLTAGVCDYKASVTPVRDDPASVVHFSQAGLDRLRIGLSDAGLDPKFFRWPPDGDPERSPYRGLRSLEADDAGIFFGRDGPIVAGLDALRGLRDGPEPRLMVILGASGAGKSSFMRAGLLPRLAREDRHFLVLPIVRPAMSALSGPTGLIESMAAALKATGIKRNRVDVETAVKGGGSALLPGLCELVAAKTPTPLHTDAAAAATAKPPTLVLPVDQAEELFLADGRDEADMFLALLRDLTSPPEPALMRDVTSVPEPALIVLFTIRSDSYDRLQNEPLLAGLRKTPFDLSPMPRGAYADVIKGPARRLDGTSRALIVEDAMVDTLLDDIEDGTSKDALPLLAFTLERLYAGYGGDGNLTLSEYRQFGGVKGAIEAAVERALKAADGNPGIPQDRNARFALLRQAMIPWLAGIDPEAGTPRRRVARRTQIPDAALPLVDLLVDQHLLASDVSKKTGEITVEPAHEALLRQWGLLQGWLAEDAGLLGLMEGVKRASSDWVTNNKTLAWLTHRGDRLATAEGLRERPDLSRNLEPNDWAYLVACRKAESGAARASRRARALVMTMMLATIAGLVGIIFKEPIGEFVFEQTTVRNYISAEVRPHVLTAEAEQALKPGETFRECVKHCPEMVVIPAGSFRMGSPDTETDRYTDEGPVRTVTIAKHFAVGKFEVTWDDWEACVAMRGCDGRPTGDNSFGKGLKPVINVTWHQAGSYVQWLSRMTGKQYRLLTEAEWEYAARAGTQTAYSFGNDATEICRNANLADQSFRKIGYSGDSGRFANCDDGHAQTAPVGSYPANAFGLHDMHGNVWEWVQDCYDETYATTPKDGSAALEPDGCKSRVLRGGSWNDNLIFLRAAARHTVIPVGRSSVFGFRVTRVLPPART